RSGRRQGPAAAATGYDCGGCGRACGGVRSLGFAGTADLVRLGDEQLADLASQHGADDVEVVELDGGRPARPQARHLARRDDQAVLGEEALKLRRLPDVALGGGKAQVPSHSDQPFQARGGALVPGDPGLLDPAVVHVLWRSRISQLSEWVSSGSPTGTSGSSDGTVAA